MSKRKKIVIICSIIVAVLVLIGTISFIIYNKNKSNNNINNNYSKLKELPKPEITGGARGELGIDKNINEKNIDEYLNREDSVYRDMRMLEDPGNYEAIGGDRFLSGYIEGFEVIPLPYIIPVSGLPSEVGDTYIGNTLFYNDNGTYIANYKESMSIIEKIFPKDKVIFLMCGGGGYAGMTKNFLVSLGWNEDKIYNIGGYWYYEGSHNIKIKKEVNGQVSYDFDKVPYHKIEFENLTKTDKFKEPEFKVKELKINTSELNIEEGTSFQLNVIVLPNEATNKELKWTSSNENVAKVSDNGLVKAIGAGNAVITAESLDGNKKVTCNVNVKKKVKSNIAKLDNISKEVQEFGLYDYRKMVQEHRDELTDPEAGHYKDKYSFPTKTGGFELNELGREVDRKNKEEEKELINKRVNFINNLCDNKKTFIILVDMKDCQNIDYTITDGAKRIFENKNYSYIEVGSNVDDNDDTIYKSKIGTPNLIGPLVIVVNGKYYKSIDTNVDTFRSDEELLNWIEKYVEF